MRQRYVGFYNPGGTTVGLEIHLPQEFNNLPYKIKRKLPSLIRRIALAGKNFWKSEAGRRLKSSRNVYQDSIDFDILGSLSAVVAMSNKFALDVEFGAPAFDMKPGFMKGAKPWTGKRKFPARLREENKLRPKSTIQMYRIIPLNVRRHVTMTKPTVFRTIHDQSTGWKHPKLKGVRILPDVFKELNNNIIPKMLDEFMKENL